MLRFSSKECLVCYYILLLFLYCKSERKDSASQQNSASAITIAEEKHLMNIARLLSIASILPLTSCEAERSFSKLKLLKNSLRSNMTNERYVKQFYCSVATPVYYTDPQYNQPHHAVHNKSCTQI